MPVTTGSTFYIYVSLQFYSVKNNSRCLQWHSVNVNVDTQKNQLCAYSVHSDKYVCTCFANLCFDLRFKSLLPYVFRAVWEDEENDDVESHATERHQVVVLFRVNRVDDDKDDDSQKQRGQNTPWKCHQICVTFVDQATTTLSNMAMQL